MRGEILGEISAGVATSGLDFERINDSAELLAILVTSLKKLIRENLGRFSRGDSLVGSFVERCLLRDGRLGERSPFDNCKSLTLCVRIGLDGALSVLMS